MAPQETPFKEIKKKKEEVPLKEISKGGNDKYRKALSGLNLSTMPGMMPGRVPGDPDIIRDTLSGVGRDVKQAFSKDNPLLGPPLTSSNKTRLS